MPFLRDRSFSNCRANIKNHSQIAYLCAWKACGNSHPHLNLILINILANYLSPVKEIFSYHAYWNQIKGIHSYLLAQFAKTAVRELKLTITTQTPVKNHILMNWPITAALLNFSTLAAIANRKTRDAGWGLLSLTYLLGSSCERTSMGDTQWPLFSNGWGDVCGSRGWSGGSNGVRGQGVWSLNGFTWHRLARSGAAEPAFTTRQCGRPNCLEAARKQLLFRMRARSTEFTKEGKGICCDSKYITLYGFSCIIWIFELRCREATLSSQFQSHTKIKKRTKKIGTSFQVLPNKLTWIPTKNGYRNFQLPKLLPLVFSSGLFSDYKLSLWRVSILSEGSEVRDTCLHLWP